MIKMTTKLNTRIDNLKHIFVIFIIIGMCFGVFSCTGKEAKKNELIDKDSETLKDLWWKEDKANIRHEILFELERRKEVDALLWCYAWCYRTPTGSVSLFRINFEQDYYFITEAFGRLKDPKTVEAICISLQYVNTDGRIAALKALKAIESPKALLPIKHLVKNEDAKIRWQAIDTLSQIKTSASMEAIFPVLLDSDPAIRWKAIHALGEIGNPQAAGSISLLLADPDESVQGIAENVLKSLGISEEQIVDWKQKARQLSIDEVYRTKMAYQKAEIEKQELTKKLESEKDLKNQLEESLKSREAALEKQNKLVESLYESDRELKSKLAQLDIARGQSGEYQRELEQLNIKVEALNEELKQAKGKDATATVKEELNKTLQEKSQLETDIKMSREKESKLRDEVASLSAIAEQTRHEAEDAKKEITAMRGREAELVQQVDELKARLNRGMAPVLVVSKPEGGTTVRMPFTMLQAVAVDDKGIRDFQVMLNDQPVMLSSTRGIKIGATDKPQNKMVINEKLQLGYGQNIIKLSVTDTDAITTEEIITITRDKEYGDLWAAVIGINNYPNARGLKYAVNDALAFKNYLTQYIGVQEKNIFLLTDQNATKENIQHLLGTRLKRQTAKEDTVIIFYAGHGAVESDPSNPDGDGFEKYLLPFDADLNDLYTTSISMDEVMKIFNRISAERLIFIADTCYSGASGGRTMVTSKTRANLSDKFYERISKGKGRVIISSCSANEISKEDDNLQHGIFSYHMLEGLKGRADQDGDGIITVSELFSYISRTVPEASAQDQHPVKKGETEGELVIGKVK